MAVSRLKTKTIFTEQSLEGIRGFLKGTFHGGPKSKGISFYPMFIHHPSTALPWKVYEDKGHIFLIHQ